MSVASILRGAAVAALAVGIYASTAAGAPVPAGTVVLNSDWETLGGTTISTPTNGVAPSYTTDDSGQSSNWNAVGGYDANRKIEFTAGQNSPFSTGNVGAVLVGDPANNGPRFNAGVADLANNPAGLVFQFDSKINDTDSYAGLRMATNFTNGHHLGVHFGNGGASAGKILVPVEGGSGFAGTQPVADFSTGVWYRIRIIVPGKLSEATSYTLEITPFGGATTTIPNLALQSDINLFGTSGGSFDLELHSWSLDDVTSTGTRGEWVIDNVSITVGVPEPVVGGMILGLGLLTASRRRHR